MATSNLGWVNKFSTTLSSGITASDTTIPLTNLPSVNEGYLVIEPDSSTAWEEIYFTSKTGSAVVCPSVGAGRGQGGSSAASHSSGATVRMDTTAEMFESLQDGTAFGTNFVTADKLATTAIKIGYASRTSDFSTGSATPVAVTSLSASVTVPAGGRSVKITAWARYMLNDTAQQSSILSIWDGTVGSGTQLADTVVQAATSTGNQILAASCMAVVTPAAGAKTYNVGLNRGSSGNATLGATSTSPAFILVEVI